LRCADSGNSGGTYLLAFPLSGFDDWGRSQGPKQLAEFLLQGINPLFEVCRPSQLLRCKICECFHIDPITPVPTLMSTTESEFKEDMKIGMFRTGT
jgi:hypothetical protein